MTKRTNGLLALVFACLVASPAGALPLVYTGTLAPEALGATGTGTAIVTIEPEAFTFRVEVSFSGLSSLTTAAHIHCCTATPGTGTALVATIVPSFPGFPLGVTAGSYDGTFGFGPSDESPWNPSFVTMSGGSDAAAAAAFLAGLEQGRAYLNIHTSNFPGGEIRVFPALVPEPTTLSLTLLGLSALGLGARRRSR
jgi:hypothetical protein